MNYLAHIYLSGADTEMMIGNFIADAVRGKQILQFSDKIQKGIALHRRIDAYTDVHPVVAQTKMRLRPTYGKYAPVIADMFYDHFLAKKFEFYAHRSLHSFSTEIYSVLKQHWSILPERVRQFLPHMIQHNWLLSYAQVSGLKQALTGLSRRTKFNSGMETATQELNRHYALYENEFERFFPDLIAFSQKQIVGLSNSIPAPEV